MNVLGLHSIGLQYEEERGEKGVVLICRRNDFDRRKLFVLNLPNTMVGTGLIVRYVTCSAYLGHVSMGFYVLQDYLPRNLR